MYLVTHQQLPAGHQTAQVAHVVADFAFKLPKAFQEWHEKSQYVVVLQTPTEEALYKLLERAPAKGLRPLAFCEPDLNDALTALAFVPHSLNRAFLSQLPLAGKNLPTTL